ncbi:MAG: acetate kinase [Oleiphilaceae bacterium]|nr:acetate kinase [Oleiphilaceae bacterium]
MSQLLLVVNCGSSSLKFSLFDSHTFEEVADGLAESLNDASSRVRGQIRSKTISLQQENLNHSDALKWILQQLAQTWDLKKELTGIGHRVVHGGEAFKTSTLINASVLAQIEQCIPLAPLHNPANLMGITLLQTLLPDTPQVAVFDTAFHQTMPEHAYVYAVPYSLYRDHGVRRYGFHGSSHRYISQQAAKLFEKETSALNIICAHLGNGASVCAIKQGQSVDTSMGLTPLEGLVMGTRSGDIDPGLFDFLLSKGFAPDEINTTLNKKSGLLGISELSNDMRTLVDEAASGHAQAALAIEVFCFRLAKYIAAMMVSLDTLDALVFTGGIGENAALVREKTMSHLTLLGFSLDTTRNQQAPRGKAATIHGDNSHPVWIIPTSEEHMIALDTQTLISTQAA